jgi:dihydroflavonol-4-reductase
LKALVTGATGFIGGHLASALEERGDEVRILARTATKALLPPSFQVASGDLTDPSAARAAVKGVDIVFHLAAIRDRWDMLYQDYYRVNVEGTRHLLQAAADEGCRFIYCSSVGVMGHPGCLGIDENYPYAAGDGKYNYSHTKALADQMTLDYATRGQLWATVVRPVITYGPGDTWGMLTRLIDMLAHQRFMPVGDGRNHLHLAYISDVVDGFLLAASSERANCRAYIVAGPAAITLNDLVRKLCDLLGVPSPRWHVPAGLARAAGRGLETLYALKRRAGVTALGSVPFITRDKVDTLALNRSYSTARAEQELGLAPRVTYDEGLPLTVNWWRNQRGS